MQNSWGITNIYSKINISKITKETIELLNIQKRINIFYINNIFTIMDWMHATKIKFEIWIQFVISWHASILANSCIIMKFSSFNILKSVLEEFSDLSRLFSNLHKSEVFLAGIDEEQSLELCKILVSRATNFLYALAPYGISNDSKL